MFHIAHGVEGHGEVNRVILPIIAVVRRHGNDKSAAFVNGKLAIAVRIRSVEGLLKGRHVFCIGVIAIH